MSKDWVGAALGAKKAPVMESTKHISPLSRVLGEADLDRPEQAPPPEAPVPPPAPATPEPAGEIADVEMPLGTDVESLATAWKSGDRANVAMQILGGLPSYTDLVALFFTIGPDGAMELGRLMDELEEEEEAPTEEEPPMETPEPAAAPQPQQ